MNKNRLTVPPNNANGSPSEKGVMEGRFQQASLFEILWHRRWSVFLMTCVCLAAGFVYITKATPVFSSDSRIYIEKEIPEIISDSRGSFMTQSKNYLYTQAELMRSTPIIADALGQLNTGGMKTFQFYEVDNKTAFLKKRLDVEVGKKDEILTVAFESPYGGESASIVNAVVDSYVTYHAQKKQTTAGQVLKILQKEQVEREKVLRDKLQAIVDFKKENGILAIEDNQQNFVLQRISRLWDSLATAQLNAMEAEARYESIKAVQDRPQLVKQLVYNEMPYAYNSGSNSMQLLNEQTQKQLENELRIEKDKLFKLTQQYTEKSPSVVACRNRIEKLLQELTLLEKEKNHEEEEFVEAALSAARQKYLVAKRKQEELENAVQEQTVVAGKASVKQAEFSMLKSELERAEKLCDLLDNRIKEINVTEDTGALNITILEVAKQDEKPVKPQKVRILAMALVLGLMLGGGLALLRDWMDQRLRSSEEIAALLGIPVLGTIPHGRGRKKPAEVGQQVHKNPQSQTAEAFRTLRTAVYFGNPGGRSKSILVTSPTPGDGKSTTVSNLAISMAQAGERVLILDADFRKPMQHKIFNLSNEEGLSNAIVNRGKLNEVVIPTGIEQLNVVPCGSIPPNPAELINSSRFAEIIKEFCESFDHVIIDAPPVMPVADARILGTVTDITLLVLRAEKSTRKSAEQARDGLISVDANLLGTVINDIRRGGGKYGYSYSQYYYGNYGPNPKRSERRKASGAV